MRNYLLLLIAVILLGGALLRGMAQEPIAVSGLAPFVYDNRVFVPVQPTCAHLGATFTWDPDSESAYIFYHNRNLTMTLGTRSCFYNDQPAYLDAPDIMLHDHLYCPASAFETYLGAPFRWDPRRHHALFEGRGGWGYYNVDPFAPPFIAGTFESYGYVPDYRPAPFVEAGVTYLPLRSVGDVIGASILFDIATDRCVVTYADTQTVLFIGDPSCYFDNQVVVLNGPPVVCGNIVYVPESLVADHWRVPYRYDHHDFRFEGIHGWHNFAVDPAPPDPIQRSMTASPVLRQGARALRAAGINRPKDPGVVSKVIAARTPGARTGHASRTGFPAVAARRPQPSMAAAGHGQRVAAAPHGNAGGRGQPAARAPQHAGAGGRQVARAPQRGNAGGKGQPAARAQQHGGAGGRQVARAPQRGNAGGRGRQVAHAPQRGNAGGRGRQVARAPQRGNAGGKGRQVARAPQRGNAGGRGRQVARAPQRGNAGGRGRQVARAPQRGGGRPVARAPQRGGYGGGHPVARAPQRGGGGGRPVARAPQRSYGGGGGRPVARAPQRGGYGGGGSVARAPQRGGFGGGGPVARAPQRGGGGGGRPAGGPPQRGGGGGGRPAGGPPQRGGGGGGRPTASAPQRGNGRGRG